jgi:hypothetical protein
MSDASVDSADAPEARYAAETLVVAVLLVV